MQKLAASLADKGLSPETGISASDEDEYGTSLATFLQYGDALSVIDQISTHAYQGGMQLIKVYSPSEKATVVTAYMVLLFSAAAC